MGNTSLPGDTAVQVAKNFKIAKDTVVAMLLNPFLRLPLLQYINPTVKEKCRSMLFCENFMNETTNKYRKQYEEDLKIKQKTNQGIQVEVDVDVQLGVKPYRCLIEEMLSQGATNKEIADEVATFMVTGEETTQIALQLLMLHMAINPVHQSRCREEVDKLINKRISNDSNLKDSLNDKDFSISELGSLKYLERCILESLRITPTVPIFLRGLQASLKVSDDLELPSGTIIGIPAWLVHRDPDNYPNPDQFDPDRFLPENVKKRHSFSFIPFSAGPRNCIGYKVGLMELKVIMAWILRNFELCSNIKLEDVKLYFDITLRPEENFNFVLRRRLL